MVSSPPRYCNVSAGFLGGIERDWLRGLPDINYKLERELVEFSTILVSESLNTLEKGPGTKKKKKELYFSIG